MKEPNKIQFYVGLVLLAVAAVLIFFGTIETPTMIIFVILGVALIANSKYRLL